MKRTWRIIPFAALAAGCSDGSSEDWSGAEQVADASAEGVESAQDAESAESAQDAAALAAAEAAVEELFRSIGEVYGVTTNGCVWNFGNGNLELASDGAYLFVLTWNPLYYPHVSPKTTITLNNLRKVSCQTELLAVDFSNVDWDESTEARPQTECGSIGYRYITVEIALAEGAELKLPNGLSRVTIAFNSHERVWL